MKIRTLHNIEIREVTKMVRTLQAGKRLPKIYCVDMGDYIKAIEGTHRLLAYKIANMEPEIEIIDFEEYREIPINEIIKETDGDNDFLEDDTLAEVLENYETVGEDLEF